ncbi:hypothetical protein Ahia01_000927600 [Argonauta hians]
MKGFDEIISGVIKIIDKLIVISIFINSRDKKEPQVFQRIINCDKLSKNFVLEIEFRLYFNKLSTIKFELRGLELG